MLGKLATPLDQPLLRHVQVRLDFAGVPCRIRKPQQIIMERLELRYRLAGQQRLQNPYIFLQLVHHMIDESRGHHDRNPAGQKTGDQVELLCERHHPFVPYHAIIPSRQNRNRIRSDFPQI